MSGGAFYQIRFAVTEDWEEAMGLAWKTFLEFEAEEYGPIGIRNFEDFITDNALKRMFVMGKYQMIVATSDGKTVGMITLRNETHISLLFVDKKYHRCGIGRALIEHMADYVKNEIGKDYITVNASPYGTEFYHRIGFTDTGELTHKDGIIYTPMKYKL